MAVREQLRHSVWWARQAAAHSRIAWAARRLAVGRGFYSRRPRAHTYVSRSRSITSARLRALQGCAVRPRRCSNRKAVCCKASSSPMSVCVSHGSARIPGTSGIAAAEQSDVCTTKITLLGSGVRLRSQHHAVAGLLALRLAVVLRRRQSSPVGPSRAEVSTLIRPRYVRDSS